MKLVKWRYFTYLSVLLFCCLIGCTGQRSQEVNSTTTIEAEYTPTVIVAQADATLAPDASATSISMPPSSTSSPPGDGDLSSLYLPEPTAEITIVPLTLTRKPTTTPVPTSSVVPGWLTYENDLVGYSFSYPPEAEINARGIDGFPTEELPEDTTTEEYSDYLQSVYPGDLCVSVRYKRGFLTVFPRGETGIARYVGACGITNVGDLPIERQEEVVTIDGQPFPAVRQRQHRTQTNQLEKEFYILLDVNDNLRIDFGVHWKSTTPRSGQQQLSEQEYDEIRGTLLQILDSFRFYPSQTVNGLK